VPLLSSRTPIRDLFHSLLEMFANCNLQLFTALPFTAFMDITDFIDFDLGCVSVIAVFLVYCPDRFLWSGRIVFLGCQSGTKQQKQTRAGYGLIEILVAVSILGVSILAMWTIFLFANTRVAVARARTVAANLANEQIEIIRNMPYDALGTTTGQPNGAIPASQVITRNRINFNIQTIIRYFDHPADGTAQGVVQGKHIRFWPTGCNWVPRNAQWVVLDFYQDGVVRELDFQEFYKGSQFNWAGSVMVGGQNQHFHLHTFSVNTCPRIMVQTQNVEKPFRLIVDGVVWATYIGPQTFTPGTGIEYEIVGQGGETILDIYPNDFKHIDVRVCWDKYPCTQPVVMSTFVAQRGQETAEDTGILKVSVIDASGNPVPNADVMIENPALGMPTIVEVTDLSGQRMIPVLDPSVEGYQLTVTKAGYSTDATHSTTVGNPFPHPNHLTINVGTITESTFVIDLLSQFQITAVNLADEPAADTTVRISGTKVISDQSPFVLKYPEAVFQTDASGNLTINSLEFDTYELILELASGNVEKTVYLPPNTNQVVFLSPHTLQVEVRNAQNNALVPDARVTLTRTDVSYEEMVIADVVGSANYDNLRTGEYDFLITLNGFEGATGQLQIAPGDNQETILLTPE